MMILSKMIRPMRQDRKIRDLNVFTNKKHYRYEVWFADKYYPTHTSPSNNKNTYSLVMLSSHVRVVYVDGAASVYQYVGNTVGIRN